MPDSFDYTTGTNSENVRLLQALIDDAPEYTEETNSRNANILKSIINNTEYTDAPQSEIEELLLRLKAKIGGEIEVDELNVTENGTYDAGVNKAYNPVTVEIPLDSKTITENGTYTASDDSLAGYDEVTVNVPTPPDSYQLKSLPTGAISTITDGTALPMPSLSVGIEAVQSGSGDPSPTNIRPITGWSAVNVNRTGKNVWDEEWEVGAINDTTGQNSSSSVTIRSKNYIMVKPSTTYFYCNLSNKYIALYYYGKNKEYIRKYDREDNRTFITPDNCYYIRFVINAGYGTTYNNDISINYPSTDTEYHAYNGQTYTTQLKDGQGNPMECYGGTLSNVNGVQTLENAMNIVDLWTLDWVYQSNNSRFYVQSPSDLLRPSDNTQAFNGLCSAYLVSPYAEHGDKAIAVTTTGSMFIFDTDYTDATALKTFLQNNNVQLVYKLATPQTIPQDNLAIASQEGTNNLWADSGDVLEGSYFKSLN